MLAKRNVGFCGEITCLQYSPLIPLSFSFDGWPFSCSGLTCPMCRTCCQASAAYKLPASNQHAAKYLFYLPTWIPQCRRGCAKWCSWCHLLACLPHERADHTLCAQLCTNLVHALLPCGFTFVRHNSTQRQRARKNACNTIPSPSLPPPRLARLSFTTNFSHFLLVSATWPWRRSLAKSAKTPWLVRPIRMLWPVSLGQERQIAIVGITLAGCSGMDAWPRAP